MKKIRLVCLSMVSVAIACAVVIFALPPAHALNPGTAPILLPNGEETSGQLEYRQYCASCHGLSGKGDGPVAQSLSKSPLDLTQLSKQHGGKFPAKMVYQAIDGRNQMSAHGSREMPIWGNVFRLRENSVGAGGPPLTDEEIKARIKPIVEYVKSLQQK